MGICKKCVLALLCVCLLLCTGCGADVVDIGGTENRVMDSLEIPIEDSVAEPVYLELRFGDGSVLRKEIFFVSVPRDWTGTSPGGGRLSPIYYTAENFEKIDGEIDPAHPLSYGSLVAFSDGRFYSFSEAYNLEVDMEGRTIIANLWRDTPYETEKEYFGVSGK